MRYDGYGDFDEQFGHLYYQQPYSHFHLKLEYRFVGQLQPGAPGYTRRNSGVMFHAQDPGTMPPEQNWPISVEMHIINGDTVLRYSQPQVRHTGVVLGDDTTLMADGRALKAGHIALQSEGQPIDFRRIELLDLSDRK